MKEFSQAQVAKKYNTSRTTVGRWVELTLGGKLNLQIKERNKKIFLIDSEHNHLIIEDLIENGRKYKPKGSFQKSSPDKDFYRIFSTDQILDILHNLQINKEIPHKYTYFNRFAKDWDEYAVNSMENNIPNTVTANHELLLKTISSIIFDTTSKFKKVKFNIIDLGAGNGYPIKDFVEKCYLDGLLNKYVALDLSKEMLKICEKNFKVWFGDKISIELYSKDLNYESIRDITLANEEISKDYKIVNLVVFGGSGFENQMNKVQNLSNIQMSLNQDDLFLLGQTLDTKEAKTFFNISDPKNYTENSLPYQNKWIPDLLGISDENYNHEFYYDDYTKTRFLKLVLEADIELTVKIGNEKKIITFNKGDKITVWRHSHHSISEIHKQLEDAGFFTEYMFTSKDKMHILTISQIKSLS